MKNTERWIPPKFLRSNAYIFLEIAQGPGLLLAMLLAWGISNLFFKGDAGAIVLSWLGSWLCLMVAGGLFGDWLQSYMRRNVIPHVSYSIELDSD